MSALNFLMGFKSGDRACHSIVFIELSANHFLPSCWCVWGHCLVERPKRDIFHKRHMVALFRQGFSHIQCMGKTSWYEKHTHIIIMDSSVRRIFLHFFSGHSICSLVNVRRFFPLNCQNLFPTTRF